MPYLNVPYYCLQDDHPEHVAQGPDHQERAGGQPPAGLGALRVREVASSHDLAQPRGASLPRRIQVRTYRDKARAGETWRVLFVRICVIGSSFCCSIVEISNV